MAGHVSYTLGVDSRRSAQPPTTVAGPSRGPLEMQPMATTPAMRRDGARAPASSSSGGSNNAHHADEDSVNAGGGSAQRMPSSPPHHRQRRRRRRLRPIMAAIVHRAGGGGGGGGRLGARQQLSARDDDDEHYWGDGAAQQQTPTRLMILPTTEEMVIERALPRASRRHGLFHALARSVTLSVALAGLASALYLAARWKVKRGVAGVAIGANGVAIIIDAFMLIDLVITKLPRVSPYAIGILDLVMLAAALTAGAFVGMSDRGYEADPSPWRHVMMVTAALTWATAGVRLVYVVWSCFDCRQIRETRRDMASVMS